MAKDRKANTTDTRTHFTLTEIANLCNRRNYQIRHIIEYNLKLEPVSWAGHCRLYSRDQMEQIKAVISEQTAKKTAAKSA